MRNQERKYALRKDYNAARAKHYVDLYSLGLSYNDIASHPQMNPWGLTPQRIFAIVKHFEKDILPIPKNFEAFKQILKEQAQDDGLQGDRRVKKNS